MTTKKYNRTISYLKPTPAITKVEKAEMKAKGKVRKKGMDVRYFRGVRMLFEDGFLSAITNPKGKRPAVAVVESGLPGYTVKMDERPSYKVLGYGYRRLNALALRLALAGHKRVNIRT